MPRKKKRFSLSRFRHAKPVPAPLIDKKTIRGHIRNFVIERLYNKGYSVLFSFDMESVQITNGKLVHAQSFMHQSGQGTVVIYMDNIMRSFLQMNKGKLLPLTPHNFKKLRKFIDPIINEQIFNLSGPTSNGEVN